MARYKLALLSAFFFINACDGNNRSAAPNHEESKRTAAVAEVGPKDEIREALARPSTPIEVIVPAVNARRGRILFTTNGCVICHQINGVGGSAGPALDGTGQAATVSPLDFSARMWRGAGAMTKLQSTELGYVINLEGQDIADLAAFVVSKDERALFTLSSVPTEMQEWFLNTPFWDSEDWEEYLERGDRIPFDDRQCFQAFPVHTNTLDFRRTRIRQLTLIRVNVR